MDQSVNADANRVITALNERLAAATLQNAILGVALATEQEKTADLTRLMTLAEQEHRAALEARDQ